MEQQHYRAPEKTHIGHIHLKVSDIDRSLEFYHRLLGFEIQARYGDQVVFMSAGEYHHHIALNTWHSKSAPPLPKYGVGLFHTAIVYPTRKDLAEIFNRLIKASYPISGASDHGVSEAIYLNDPDGNGIELYCDKPIDQWPKNADGSINLSVTKALDLNGLLDEL